MRKAAIIAAAALMLTGCGSTADVTGSEVTAAETSAVTETTASTEAKSMTEKTKLTGAIYSCGGGMEGESDHMELHLDDDGRVKLHREYTEGNGCDTIITDKEVPADVLEKAAEIFDKSGMKNWGELPRSEYELLDAPTSYAQYITADGSFSVSSSYEIPDYSVISELYTLLDGYAPVSSMENDGQNG